LTLYLPTQHNFTVLYYILPTRPNPISIRPDPTHEWEGHHPTQTEGSSAALQ